MSNSPKNVQRIELKQSIGDCFKSEVFEEYPNAESVDPSCSLTYQYHVNSFTRLSKVITEFMIEQASVA